MGLAEGRLTSSFRARPDEMKSYDRTVGRVGDLVGAFVGEALGAGVGSFVGLLDRDADGAVVTLFVGLDVGVGNRFREGVGLAVDDTSRKSSNSPVGVIVGTKVDTGVEAGTKRGAPSPCSMETPGVGFEAGGVGTEGPRLLNSAKKSLSEARFVDAVDSKDPSDDTTIRAVAANISTEQTIKRSLNSHGESFTQRGTTLSRHKTEGSPRRLPVWILADPLTTVKAKTGSNNSLGTGFGPSPSRGAL